MLTWIAGNAATLIVSALLVAAIGLVIRKMVRDYRAGKGGCGCGCENCPSRGACRKP